jgi:hypothetical protein
LENENPNHNGIPLWWLKLKAKTLASFYKNVKELELCYIVGADNVKELELCYIVGAGVGATPLNNIVTVP